MANPERWKRFPDLPEDLEKRLEQLVEALPEMGVAMAYVFGSLARSGTDGAKANDVDLALLCDEQPAFRLRRKLQDLLGTERLDLVDLRKASPVLPRPLSPTPTMRPPVL